MRLDELPSDILNIIKEYFPIKITIRLNKKLYIENHNIMKRYINKLNYDRYIRDMIERDNSFVIEQLLKENFNKWLKNNNFFNKNNYYYNYVYFLKEYSIINNSIKCMEVINCYFTNSGLSKNQHKKNTIKNIRWIN